MTPPPRSFARLSCHQVAERLQELYKAYGFFIYRASYFTVDKPEKSKAVFERLRGAYPKVSVVANSSSERESVLSQFGVAHGTWDLCSLPIRFING